MKIQVQINEDGALRNQRHAFSNRFTLVSELLQNARRAGASRIEVQYDPATQVLIVHDNGRGLDDFQKLLSFHESGWDSATCAEDRPFGIGFSSCLYAATCCVVASGHRRADIGCAAALARESFVVEEQLEADPVVGTRLELHGVQLPELARRIEDLCLGFPLQVWFNGEPLRRDLAADRLTTQTSDVGSVHLKGTLDGKHSHHTWVYLQGFCVLKPSWSVPGEVNVVHLDSRQFTARLPDRDRLIDEDLQRKRIHVSLKDCWRKSLEVSKAQLAPEHFVSLYYPVMRSWGHTDLLNDIEVLPTTLCNAIVGYPIQGDSTCCDYLQPVERTPTRHDIETGVVQLVALHPMDDDNGARWMLARAMGWVVLDWLGLSADHWALKHVRFLEEESVRVTPVDEHLRTALDGRWISPTVILSRAVRVRVGSDEALITDAAVGHKGNLFVPDGETTGLPVQQLSSFTDGNERFLEADRNADRDLLTDLLRLQRAKDPLKTLESLLQSLRLGKYPLLQGRTFQLTVGVGCSPGHSVELVNASSISCGALANVGGGSNG